MSNVIQLPRPQSQRLGSGFLGFYVRVGRNDHGELLHLIAAGEQGIFGIVIDANRIDRHRDLITEARRRNFDVILDSMTQQMGFPDGLTECLSALLWGLVRHHNITDFDGEEGRRRAAQIVETAATNGFTQILGPTHLLNSPNDPWLRRDIAMMGWVADQIRASGVELGLIYSLAMPMILLRQAAERRAVISAIADAPCDALWLKVENFGDDATGEKIAAYVEACRDFHERGVPIIGDHVGGLPGLGALAFGGVGGIAHGVTMKQNFRTTAWRRPRQPGGGGTQRRVYFPSLDLMLKPDAARVLLATSSRIKAMCGCRDTHCCPHGTRDMLAHPARHATYQRAREIESLSRIPPSLRSKNYLNETVRRVSDNVASVAASVVDNEDLAANLRKKQQVVGRFRQVIAHMAETPDSTTIAASPPRRQAPQGG